MFYGEYCHAVNRNERVVIIIVTRGLEKSLFLFSLQEWKIQEEKFNADF